MRLLFATLILCGCAHSPTWHALATLPSEKKVSEADLVRALETMKPIR